MAEERSVLEQLQQLVRLQELDNSIKEINLSFAEKPKRIQEIDREIQEAEQAYKAYQDGLEALKKERRRLEEEVEQAEQKIKKSQLKLMEVKNNKEYKAMLSEIEELKKAKVGWEDKLIDLMEKTEEESARSKEVKQIADKKMTEGKVQKEQLEAAILNFREELETLTKERERLAAEVDPELLKQYEFLRNRLRGRAVAQLRNSICLACHIHIPPQLCNELQRFDRIIACPSCLRILYFQREPETPKE